jgi:hypothetical protein
MLRVGWFCRRGGEKRTQPWILGSIFELIESLLLRDTHQTIKSVANAPGELVVAAFFLLCIPQAAFGGG